VTALAWAYMRWGALPRSVALLDGVKPVVVAIVVQALWRLGRAVLHNWLDASVAVAAVAASLAGLHELAILALAGLVVALVRARPKPTAALILPFGGLVPAAAATSAAGAGLLPLFLVFLKIGSVLFGSGYVLLAFLRSDLVERYHWLTNDQLLDAISVGQLTPGPVSTTATFIGWMLHGAPGALVATVAMFLPAFIFVALSGPLVPRLRRSPLFGGILDGVNVASLALMATVSWQLGRAAVTSWWTAALVAASLLVLLRTRINSMWLILGGAAAGTLARLF